jgi:biofilm PGA synthesis N-glycosyltransferase PgaC
VLVPMNVVLQGRRVVFEREAIAWDWPSASIEQESRRKVRTLAGNFQLFALRPELLSPWRNRLLLQTLCHKVLRLLVPAMMGLALLANVALALDGPRWRLLLIAHLGAYALAVLGLRSERLRGLRVVRLGASFVQMNLLVVRGFLEFVGNREAHLWRSR